MRRHQPCVVADCISEWKALSCWGADYLDQRLGHVEVSVTRTKGSRSTFVDDASKVTTMKFGEFLRLDHEDASPYKYYLMQRAMDKNLSQLLPDISVPDLFDHGRLFLINFWYAPGWNVTPLHCDFVSNLLAVVAGRKRVVLLPPGARVYPDAAAGNFSRVDIDHPDPQKFPRFSRAQAAEVTLEAGEMLFIPGLWWHQVYSEKGIAVNFWWRPSGAVLVRTVLSRQMIEFMGKRWWHRARERLIGHPGSVEHKAGYGGGGA